MTLYKRLELRLSSSLEQSKQKQTLLGTLIRGISAAITGVFLSYFLSGFVQILIVRQLGKLLYGEYATLTATLGLMASLLGFGLDVWVLSEGGRDHSTLAMNIGHVLWAKIVGAVVLLALVALAWSNQMVETPAFVIGVLGIIFDSFTSTGYSALRALNRNGSVAIFQVVSPLVLLGAIGAMQYVGASVLLLFFVQALTSAALATTLLLLLRKLVGPLLLHRFRLWYLVSGAWLFVAADVLSNIYTQSSIVILGRLVDQTLVGLWKPALNVIGFTFLVPSLLFLVGLPQLNAVTRDRRQYRSLLLALSAGALCYGVAVMIGLWLFNGFIVQLLFGHEYDAALPLVRAMSLVPLFKSGSFVCVAILLSLNRQLVRVGLQAIVTVLSVIGGLVFIPIYGLQGAVWLYVAIEALIFILYLAGAAFQLRRAWR
ncbi:MAG TPA: oligosaccharide flippase family protein [Kouleothrix sp.]|uniref:oligosaccharide flippase family protein n=1 Tax=Kouleothrix sp. TaxID=2779161 RepID=UPI002C047616|nr:oligosaccharide flippase family protein [Kouleothrix sp.]